MSKGRSIAILHFPSMHNYGTAMMGIVALTELVKRMDDDALFYCDYRGDLQELSSELEAGVLDRLRPLERKRDGNALSRFIYDVRSLRRFDAVVVLGGDDLSEYYRNGALRTLFKYAVLSALTPLFLVGQTIGPFTSWRKAYANFCLRRSRIFTRDPRTFEHLTEDIGLRHVTSSADLALRELPRQGERERLDALMEKSGLEPRSYICIVVSGIQGSDGFYTSNRDDYIACWAGIVERLVENGQRVCLLAHTLPPYGDEPALISAVIEALRPQVASQCVCITSEIGPSAARWILGNSILTITGRMHAAVSTFQMGRPAISLAYSVKYHGVIGGTLGCEELVIDADDEELWASKRIVDLVAEKTKYVLQHTDELENRIGRHVLGSDAVLRESLDRLCSLMDAGAMGPHRA